MQVNEIDWQLHIDSKIDNLGRDKNSFKDRDVESEDC